MASRRVKFVADLLGVLLCGLIFTFSGASGDSACHATRSDKLNIHLVPHTHDDVGWLKTVDQYFYGSYKAATPVGVQYILDSVVSELEKDPNRRFVYVETSFFWRWWEDLNESGRESVKKLVSEGRLEFLLGGWCMSDEATPHYSSMIDQMTLGLKFLNDTFAEHGRPNAAWQIDPFGHSSELAIEFAEMGYDGLFVGRIDYEDHMNRKNTKTMEMIWRPDPSLGRAGDLFTSVLFDLYTPPQGFCFDVLCSDDPIMDNRKLHGYNVDRKIRQFEYEMKKYQETYKTNHVLVTMGQDFTYSIASSWFKNIDKLIKYTNALGNLNLLYSTPSCYLKALNDLNTTWSVKESEDFFPYGSDEHSYWTGYFTSRPTFKYFVYLSNNILQATKQIAVLLGDENLLDEESVFKRAVAIAQHHDGVSGTERQHVTNDYGLYLNEGLEAGIKIYNQAYRYLYGANYPAHSYGNLRNISELQISENAGNFVITIHNLLAHSVNVPVKFPIRKNANFGIFGQQGIPVQYDIIPIPNNLIRLPGRNSAAVEDVVFIAENLPPAGVTNYYVQAKTADFRSSNEAIVDSGNTILDNGKVQLTFQEDGLLYSITKNNVVYPFHQNFYYYIPTKGFNTHPENRASGAYIFRPTSKYSFSPSPLSYKANITKYIGKNVMEIHQTFNDWLSQIIRLYKNSDEIEFEWLVGPLPVRDFNGMELVTKYTTDIASNYTFYTDSNGRRWEKRILNYRKSWKTRITEPIASNYYPVTTAIKIKDAKKQLTVIVDRPQGGSSISNGEIELMLHRRLLYDDDKGVAEPLDEHAFGTGLVVRGKHVIQFTDNDEQKATNDHRLRTLETVYQPVVTFAQSPYTLRQWIVNFNKSFSLLTSALPLNVHILTLERWRDGQILLRLEHIFEINESESYSKPVSINVKSLFYRIGLAVDRFEELTLAANQEKKNLKRLKWNSEASRETGSKPTEAPNYYDGIITLQPMEIKTLLLYVSRA